MALNVGGNSSPQGPRGMEAFTMMGAVGSQSAGTPQSGMVASPMQHQQPQHNMQQV